MTDTRQQRGLEIAAVCRIAERDGVWSVPSQSGNGRYTVRIGLHLSECHCTCPDHELRGVKCKHMYAVEYFEQRQQNSDGSETITKSVTVTDSTSDSKTVHRVTYSQDWSAYNKAQTCEKSQFQVLLHDLCRTVEEPPPGKGRPRLPLRDAVFAIAFKVFSTFSGRRFISDLCDAQDKGYISKVPHFNSIFNYLEKAEMTPLLKSMIERSSAPLRAVETGFAVDATGIASNRFVKWFDKKYGNTEDSHDWLKLHLVCGVKTNIVCAVQTSGKDDHDSKFLPALVESTASRFDATEFYADKGYSGRENLMAIQATGATPYVAFRSNTKLGVVSKHGAEADALWDKMFHFYSFNRENFLARYHQRSNVESTFMAIKAKFGDEVRSKGDIAQANEVLCKVLCHNICCLIQSMFELGIEPTFGLGCTKTEKPAQNLLPN